MAQNTLASRRAARPSAVRPSAVRRAAAQTAAAHTAAAQVSANRHPAVALPPRPLHHTFAATTTSSDLLSQAGRATPDAALTLVASSRSGLTHAEARDRRSRFGPNLVPRPRQPRLLELAARAVAPLNRLLLLAVAAASFVVAAGAGQLADGRGADAGGVASLTAVGAAALALGVVTSAVAIEVGRGRRARSRQASAGGTTRVTRVVRGVPVTGERPSVDLVPGDVIELRAGERVPADVRLLESHAIRGLGNAADTARGSDSESRAGVSPGAGVTEDAPIALMGERVTTRWGSAVVLQTGAGTKLAALTRSAGQRGQAGAPRLRLAASVTGFVAVAVLAAALWAARAGAVGGWPAAVAAACGVAVAVTPVLQPFVSGVARARARTRLAATGVQVNDDAALGGLAAIDTLVIDKTGTLTSGRIELSRCVDPRGRGSDRVLGWAAAHSHFRTTGRGPVDAAILEASADDLLRATAGRDLIAELPFDVTRRRGSVVIHEHDALQVIVTVGAPLTLLDLSEWEQIGETQRRLTASRRAQIADLADRLQADGARTLAVAIRDVPVAGPRSRDIEYAVDDEVQLTFVGLLSFSDRPRSSARSAVREFCARGIDVTLVTGDRQDVARSVAHTVGLPSDHVVVGADTDALTDGQLATLALDTQVVACATPAHKARIVAALSATGRQVGYLGDGYDDLPAMAAARVAIAAPGATAAVEERATVVARDPNLTAIAKALRDARRLRAATRSYVHVTCVAQLAVVAVALIASFFLPASVVSVMPLALLVHALLFGGLAAALVFRTHGVRRPESR